MIESGTLSGDTAKVVPVLGLGSRHPFWVRTILGRFKATMWGPSTRAPVPCMAMCTGATPHLAPESTRHRMQQLVLVLGLVLGLMLVDVPLRRALDPAGPLERTLPSQVAAPAAVPAPPASRPRSCLGSPLCCRGQLR